MALHGKWSSGNLVFYDGTQDIFTIKKGTGGLVFGEDNLGIDLKLYGATTGAYAFWDETNDKLIFDKADVQLGTSDELRFGDTATGDIIAKFDGTNFDIRPAAAAETFLLGADSKVMNTTLKGSLTIGKSGTGHDVKLHGTTSGAYMEWDESADRLNVVGVAARAISGEEHLVDLTYGGTVAASDSMVGLNIAVTPTGVTANATWIAGIFAKITQSTDSTTGYLSAAEFEVNITGAYNTCDYCVMALNSNDRNTGNQPTSSWIWFCDYGTREPDTLFNLRQTSAGTTDPTVIFSTVSGGFEANCDYTIRVAVGATPYWILCSSTAAA